MSAEASFKCIKTCLTVLFSMILVGTSILLILFIFGLYSHGDTFEMKEIVDEQSNLIKIFINYFFN